MLPRPPATDERAQRQLAPVAGDQLQLVAAARDPVVDDREHPRRPALVAVDVADRPPARELDRRRVEVLAVGDGERCPIGVGEIAVVAEREPDRGRGAGCGGERPRRAAAPSGVVGAAAAALRGPVIASVTRASKPVGGSIDGATISSSSASAESRSIRARHSGHSVRWSSAQARSSPSAIPSATSAPSSRSRSQSAGLIGPPPRVAAKLLRRGSDPRLRGPERDLLDLADLTRRVAVTAPPAAARAAARRAARRAPRAARPGRRREPGARAR